MSDATAWSGLTAVGRDLVAPPVRVADRAATHWAPTGTSGGENGPEPEPALALNEITSRRASAFDERQRHRDASSALEEALVARAADGGVAVGHVELAE